MSALYDPSPAQVRRFFCEAWRKSRAALPLTPMEAIVADWAAHHPEYHADLADADMAEAAVYPVDGGRTNPFLHLSMHLSISEQLAIDRPAGIRQAFDLLVVRTGSPHDAQHVVMDCLGETMWTAQRHGQPPDSDAYLDCIRRKATR